MQKDFAMRFSIENESDSLNKVKKIDNQLIMLLEISSLARYKNIPMSKTFSEEFFKGISAIVTDHTS